MTLLAFRKAGAAAMIGVVRRWVASTVLCLLCGAIPVSAEMAEASSTGTVTGIILRSDGHPMAGGKVVLFRHGMGPPPAPGHYLRPPDEMVDVDAAGGFAATVDAGRYYLSATFKSSGDLIGPPAPGDHVYPSPAALQQGASLIEIRPGTTTDLGVVHAIPFTPDSVPPAPDITAIEGTIKDDSGQPVANAIVLAFENPAMVGRPAFISERTGADGRYQLRFQAGGTYFLKIRTFQVQALEAGGYPTADEIIGVYGGSQPRPCSVADRDIVSGVDIVGKYFARYGKDVPAKRGKMAPQP